MFRWQFLFIAALAAALLAACQCPPLLDGTAVVPTLPTPAVITAAPGPPDPDVHIVSLYAGSPSLAEMAAASGDYLIAAQEFEKGHLQLRDDLQVVLALGRVVTDTLNPPSLIDVAEDTAWRLYLPGDSTRAEIACAPVATEDFVPEIPPFWQEVYMAFPPGAGPAVSTGRAAIAEVCYVPPAMMSGWDVGGHAEKAQVWIDEAVVLALDGRYVLYRFGPQGGPGGGLSGCKNTCYAVFSCRSSLGCFAQSVCMWVCK